MTDALRTLVRFIAVSGGPARHGATLNGYAGRELYWHDVGGLRFIADPSSEAAEVYNPEEHDPFVSWSKDGKMLRRHYGRYGGPKRIEAIAVSLLIDPTTAAMLTAISKANDSNDMSPAECWNAAGPSILEWRQAGKPNLPLR